MEPHKSLNLLAGQIPNDNSSQVYADYYINYYFSHLKPEDSVIQIMDLGCGAGNSIDRFRKKDSQIKWIGLDIESSPEVNSRTRADAEFHTFDGVHIPFDDNHFDLIFSKQVFEHVRYPNNLLKEVYRVLKPGGYFIGSTSHLEPYHSYSYWNYTPYGFRVLLEEANLQLIEIRPSIDAFALLTWNILVRLKGGSKLLLKLGWWNKNESLLNLIISLAGKVQRRPASSINAVKLLVCGQFCFIAAKSNPITSNHTTDIPTT